MEFGVIKEMEIAGLIVQILHFFTYVRKRYHGLLTEMKKENPVSGSIEEQKKDRKSKEKNSLDKIQHLQYRLLHCN